MEGRFIDNRLLASILHKRDTFAHKGDFGRGLIVAGCKEMSGAAILAARAALRSGIGLLHVHIPESIYNCVQGAVPEAMVERDAKDDNVFADAKLDIGRYDAVAVGPGLGQGPRQCAALEALLTQQRQLLQAPPASNASNASNAATSAKPMVIDADALNIIAANPTLLHFLGEHCILTPHPGEFNRLQRADNPQAEDTTHNYEKRLEAGIRFAQKYKVHLVLKGVKTAVIQPNGSYLINPTGNPGMATGGSGDVLTGILLSLLAQHYTCHQASLLGVYLHGLSGDIALEKESQESLVASDLYRNLGAAFKTLI